MVKKNQIKTHSSGVTEIKCIVCDTVKPILLYSFNASKNIYSKKCLDCKYKRGFQNFDDRYVILLDFVKKLMITAQPGDLERLKEIFSTL